MNENTTSAREKAKKGFMSDTVLIPEVRAMIISFPLTMKTRSISIDTRKEKGSMRWM
jgi:hypothetical protein